MYRERKTGRSIQSGLSSFRLTPTTVSAMLAGDRSPWTAEEIHQLIEEQLLGHVKMRDLDGTIKRPSPSEFTESMVRAGCDLQTALSILYELTPVENGVKSMTALWKLIADKLEEKSPETSSHDFLKQQPLGVTVVGGDFDGQMLDYDLIRNLILRVIGKHGFRCLSSSVLIDTTTSLAPDHERPC